MLPLRSLCLVALVVLAGCNARTGEPAPEPVAVAGAAAPPVMAEADLSKGTSCAPAIARTRAIVESDIATGNIDPPVGQRFTDDLDAADKVCAAGRARDALRLLSAAKVRYGYR